MAKTIKVGDAVHIASGGPTLTVERIRHDTESNEYDADLVYFDTDDHGKWHGPIRITVAYAALRHGEAE